MTFTQAPNEFLRVDELGRVRTGVERRAELLVEYDRSAMSGAAFARWAGIKYQTFAGWLHRRRKESAGAANMSVPATCSQHLEQVPGARVGWAEIVVGEAVPSGTKLSVRLPGGASFELDGTRASLRLAAELLHELERAGANRGGVTC